MFVLLSEHILEIKEEPRDADNNYNCSHVSIISSKTVPPNFIAVINMTDATVNSPARETEHTLRSSYSGHQLFLFQFVSVCAV